MDLITFLKNWRYTSEHSLPNTKSFTNNLRKNRKLIDHRSMPLSNG